MSGQGWMDYAREQVEDSRAHGEGWADIVVDLQGEGIGEEVIAEVLRERQAWAEEAQEWKQHGFPYEEIVLHLREEVAAPWGDVAHALMSTGMISPDVLRVVLPLMGEESPLPVVQAALLEGPEDSNEAEAWEVIGYFFPEISRDDGTGALEEAPA
ncbi:hypothetical protein [Geothrix sp. PMB-07]|uniref:hypothetical protein n=1 Tax=Geothrix sp. PMB-07 TaxID=3068640 RepID=UPI00274172B6|nr:hypothetical protein [Geothrix sp. PMB-07]WLT30881.1 hypothetical protein Q9293_14270 [Geothrix sp. PMB-07]